jgi:hypothetical protein
LSFLGLLLGQRHGVSLSCVKEPHHLCTLRASPQTPFQKAFQPENGPIIGVYPVIVFRFGNINAGAW